MKATNIKKQGVYLIRNIVNGKLYIGSTTDSFQCRWQSHKQKLDRGTHPNKHLQCAWIKYGRDNFNFEIIEITSPEKALSREGFYIDHYRALDPKYGYNIQIVDTDGKRSFDEETRKAISNAAKKQWKCSHGVPNFKAGAPSWNKGLKCKQISEARRKMFSSVEVYKNDILLVTFRSVIDLSDWTKSNELPGITYYTDKNHRPNKGTRTTFILASNIQRAIRNKAIYRGLKFKRSRPLSPEMGIAKWENCWDGEIPNQQPSQPLIKLEGSETNG